MKYLYLILFLTTTLSANSQKNESVNYQTQLAISKKRLSNTADSIFQSQLQTELLENIFPHWYGTPWDYNGYTNIPQKGEIACGYFISTTLKHLGFNLNRYDIAKMYSSDIIKVLCHDDSKTFYDFKSFQRYCDNMQDGIYILGLSNHVGFLSIENGKGYFLHSDYSSEDGVRKESIENSYALENSNSFWVGNFSNHPKTIKYYKTNQEYVKLE